jgi:CHAT domain-containing protein
MTAEYKGAKAVISTLWSVNDSSTGKLMGDFYQRWAAGAGKVTKVEALRQAQLDLLQGTATAQESGNDRGSAKSKPEGPAMARYSHPYYWAPFVLMGNWR